MISSETPRRHEDLSEKESIIFMDSESDAGHDSDDSMKNELVSEEMELSLGS